MKGRGHRPSPRLIRLAWGAVAGCAELALVARLLSRRAVVFGFAIHSGAFLAIAAFGACVVLLVQRLGE